MCGITVVICKKHTKNAVSLLLTSLEQLQNRGYDSFGLSAIVDSEEHKVVFDIPKVVFNINKVACITPSDTFETFKNKTKDIKTDIVIGHTRWATHGVISVENAHPHLSMSKKIALVHNGIIENYKAIKDRLSSAVGAVSTDTSAVSTDTSATYAVITDTRAASTDTSYIFTSQTDSEVIANLIDYYYVVKRETIENAIQKAVAELSGTYGLAIQCIDHPDKIFIIRNGSPLLIGENEDYIMATSEVSGFVNQMKHYYTLKKNDLIILSQKDGTSIYSENHSDNMCADNMCADNVCADNYSATEAEARHLSKNMKKMTCKNDTIVLTPAPFKHWTIKEIHEQKDTLLRATNNGARLHLNKIKLGGIDMLRDYIGEIETILLVGCGTSLHACQIGASFLKTYQNGYLYVNHISAYDAAEFTISDIPKRGKTLVIMISQSGETMDLHRIMPFVKERGCLTMGIINVVDSLIAREVDCGIYMNAGRENAVASTKSFTSSLMILKLFSIWFFQESCLVETLLTPPIRFECKTQNMIGLGSKFAKVCQNIRDVIEQVGKLNEIYKYNYEYPFTEDYPFNECNTALYNSESKITYAMLSALNKDNLFILGKGRMEYIAKEAALKLKEICYIHAEAYSGSALKHGPFALLTDGFPVIFLINKEHKDKMWNAYQEVKSRRAFCLVISEMDLPVSPLIKIPENDDLQEILYMVALQHICYYISQMRGINPDTPRNLAKVVTVE